MNDLPTEFNKSSYHRSLVDEHRLMFTVNQDSVTLIDYTSAEFGKLEMQFSVSLIQGDQRLHFICDESGFSRLPEIEDTIAISY